MTPVYLSHNAIFSNLGSNANAVFEAVASGQSGLNIIEDESLLSEKFCAAYMDSEMLKTTLSSEYNALEYTKLEQMMIHALQPIINAFGKALDGDVGLLISTTKGNIDALDKNSPFPDKRAYLHVLGDSLQSYFGFKNKPIIVSNACVSGVLAVSIAKRMIEAGRFKHVFVVGGDILSKFILTGFNSFQALSPNPCKPYDENRVGINLGEAAASVLVTSSDENLSETAVIVKGDATCNDANHISGPSRTGEGLYRSIKRAMEQAKVQPEAIDYISAHGTATLFNDEMEAIAFNRLNLQHVPTNSLKGYFGHTLGASGLVETIIGMHALHNNLLIASKGYETHGISKPLNIITAHRKAVLKTFLKTASGFGGCNTAAVFEKI